MSSLQGRLLLVLTALIWGLAFVAQSVSMDYIGPWTFTCLRSFIAGVALIFVIPLLKKSNSLTLETFKDKTLLLGGLFCGFFLASASMFQQIGIIYTTVGKAGFITALYVVFVPVFSIFLKKRIPIHQWIAVVIALIGLYFLSIHEGFTISKGDGLILICAILFAFHILVIDHYGKLVDGLKMSCIQFFVVGFICLLPMLLVEKPTLNQIIQASLPILYAGFLSSAVGYTLQIIGQKYTEPTIATLLLSLEAVFAAIAGYFILHQVLSFRELLGCALVFIAILLAQYQK